MDSWSSYPSIFAVGHKAVSDLLTDIVSVEEKIDGSQIQLGAFVLPEAARRATLTCVSEYPGFEGVEVALLCRSKGAQLQMLAPEKMFQKAVDTVIALGPKLRPNWTYAGEFLSKPRHNALIYERVPRQHIIIFDVKTGNESYLSWEDKAAEAERLGLETVPRLYHGKLDSSEILRALLDTVSVLGGQKIEGVVLKNHERFGIDKKVLMAKFVSEAFKEVHAAEWKTSNPTQGDVIQLLIAKYRTPARWAKAVQHLREVGKLEGSPRDIGLLMREVPEDIEKECKEEILRELWMWAWPKVRRGTAAGLAEWYKDELLKSAFQEQIAS